MIKRFNNVCRTLRKERGLTQYELADIIGVSESTILRAEKKSIPRKENLKRIISFFGEKEFYKRFASGDGWDKLVRKEKIEKKIAELWGKNEDEKLLDLLYEYGKNIESEGTKDVVFYRTMLVLCYHKMGVDARTTIRELISLLKMSTGKNLDDDSVEYSEFDIFIINNLAICFTEDDRWDIANGVYEVLFESLSECELKKVLADKKMNSVSRNWQLTTVGSGEKNFFDLKKMEKAHYVGVIESVDNSRRDAFISVL